MHHWRRWLHEGSPPPLRAEIGRLHCKRSRATLQQQQIQATSLEDWQDVAAKVAEEPEIQSSEVRAFSFPASASSFPILSLPTASTPSGQGEKVAHVPTLEPSASKTQPANCSAASILVINSPGNINGHCYRQKLKIEEEHQKRVEDIAELANICGEVDRKEDSARVGHGGQVDTHVRKEGIVRVGHGGNTKHARVEFDKHDMSIKQPAQAPAKQPAQASATAIVGHGGMSGGKEYQQSQEV